MPKPRRQNLKAFKPLFSDETGTALAIVLVALSAYSAACLFLEPTVGPFYTTVLLWTIWALVPPFFFLVQWYLFDKGEDELAQLKYSHELASKFWLGGVGVLSAVLLYAQDVRKQPSRPCVAAAAVAVTAQARG